MREAEHGGSCCRLEALSGDFCSFVLRSPRNCGAHRFYLKRAGALAHSRSSKFVRLCGERRDVFTSSRTGSSSIRGLSWQWDITWKRVATLARDRAEPNVAAESRVGERS